MLEDSLTPERMRPVRRRLAGGESAERPCLRAWPGPPTPPVRIPPGALSSSRRAHVAAQCPWQASC